MHPHHHHLQHYQAPAGFNIIENNGDEKNRGVEFYDFLQVNTDSTKSEVIDMCNFARRDDEEVNQEARELRRSSQFIDFLSVGRD